MKSTVRLFADDCLLYREVRSFHGHLTLQSDLKNLEEWAARWGMRFNAQKCYVLSTKPRSHFYYRLGGTILKHVEQNSYIGIENNYTHLMMAYPCVSHWSNCDNCNGPIVDFHELKILHCHHKQTTSTLKFLLYYPILLMDTHFRL